MKSQKRVHEGVKLAKIASSLADDVLIKASVQTTAELTVEQQARHGHGSNK